MPYFAFNQFLYGDFLFPFRPAWEAVHGEYLWLYEKSPYFYFQLFYLNPFLLLSLPGIYLARKDKKWLIILVVFLVFFVFFSLLPHKEFRFSLPFLPYLALLASRIFEIQNRWVWLLIILLLPGIFHYLTWISTLPPEGPEIFKECRLEKGAILSSAPLITKFYDNPVIGFYSLQNANETYQKFRENVTYIIWVPESFPCRGEACRMRDEVFMMISNENELKCRGKGVYGEDIYIFITAQH